MTSMARPEIKTGAELKGKTLGVSTLTGGTTLMVDEVLEKAYKLKESEYKLSGRRHLAGALRGFERRLGAGDIHGPAVYFPRGQRRAFASSPTFTNISGRFCLPPTSRTRITSKSNRDEIVRYLKSMIEATHWLYDPKNKEEALAIHMKVLKSTREAAEEDYKYLVEDFKPFPRDGAVSKAVLGQDHGVARQGRHLQGKKIPPMTRIRRQLADRRSAKTARAK